MKVYVLIERIYNYDSGEENTSYIDGVYNTKQKALDKMQEEIKHNINDFEFVEDTDNEQKKDFKILFYNYQENWQNYIEFEVVESEVE